MADQPNSEAQPVKTFDFSKEDQEFLQPRQVLINQHQIIINDLNYVMSQYIINSIVPRLALNPKEWKFSFNVMTNKLTATRLPPEILVPPKDIVIPGKK